MGRGQAAPPAFGSRVMSSPPPPLMKASPPHLPTPTPQTPLASQCQPGRRNKMGHSGSRSFPGGTLGALRQCPHPSAIPPGTARRFAGWAHGPQKGCAREPLEVWGGYPSPPSGHWGIPSQRLSFAANRLPTVVQPPTLAPQPLIQPPVNASAAAPDLTLWTPPPPFKCIPGWGAVRGYPPAWGWWLNEVHRSLALPG